MGCGTLFCIAKTAVNASLPKNTLYRAFSGQIRITHYRRHDQKDMNYIFMEIQDQRGTRPD